MGDGHDDASAEAEAGDVADVDELVGDGSADSEDLGGLSDGEGQGVVDVVLHALREVVESAGSLITARSRPARPPLLVTGTFLVRFPVGEPANVCALDLSRGTSLCVLRIPRHGVGRGG